MCLRFRDLILLSFVVFCAVLSACKREPERASTAESKFSRSQPRKIVFQTDWFPQAEHGGFYQALAKGFYAEAGLDVTLVPGGPNPQVKLKVARGDAEFGMNRSDDVIVTTVNQGLPLLVVAAFTQHDHLALIVHEESPVRSFADLDRRTVTASVGLAYLPFLQRKYGVSFNIVPNHGGMAAFLANKSAIQQCLFTNEPFVAQQHGLRTRVLPISDSGYDAYHVIFCRREFARDHPAAARAFVAASLRGWRDYIEQDPAPAHAEIRRRNSNMSDEFLNFSRGEMIKRQVITGDASRGEALGKLSPERLQAQIDALVELKLLDRPAKVSEVATREFLPAATQ